MNTRQFILATLLTLLCASVASAQNTVTYQGQLNNAANEGVNASYPMMFRLYLNANDNDAVWSESYDSVSVVCIYG